MSRTGREPKQQKDASKKGSRSNHAKISEEKIKVNRQTNKQNKLNIKKVQKTNKKKNGRKPPSKTVKEERNLKRS